LTFIIVKIKKEKISTPKKMSDERNRVSLMGRVFRLIEINKAGLPDIKVMGLFCFAAWSDRFNLRFL
jgi:hypothetical protein